MGVSKLTKHRFLCMQTGGISRAFALNIRQECALIAPLQHPRRRATTMAGYPQRLLFDQRVELKQTVGRIGEPQLQLIIEVLKGGRQQHPLRITPPIARAQSSGPHRFLNAALLGQRRRQTPACRLVDQPYRFIQVGLAAAVRAADHIQAAQLQLQVADRTEAS
ncbi:hypothetical protein D3C75_920190 [compost metagenome]